LDQDSAVIIPVSRQKHVLPFAEWGRVRTDDDTIVWDADNVRRLAVFFDLRAAGFSESALSEPSPRWATLSRLDADRKRFVVTAWPLLDPWRTRPSCLAVAARATRKPKEDNQ
jgi:hypothetical protein